MERRRHSQVACIIALVVGLHLIALWFLMARSRIILPHRQSNGFEIVMIPPPSAAPEQAAFQRLKQHESQRTAPRRHSSVTGIAAQSEPPGQSNAVQASIDWADELTRAAKDAAKKEPAQAAKDFGFPHRPAAPAKATQFEWDYAATHRVESIAGGGLLINIDDHCVLILFPLPFFACGPGNKEANGELFKHMGESRNSDP